MARPREVFIKSTNKAKHLIYYNDLMYSTDCDILSMASSNSKIPNICVTRDLAELSLYEKKKKKSTFKRRNTLKDFNYWFSPNGDPAGNVSFFLLEMRQDFPKLINGKESGSWIYLGIYGRN